MLSRTLNIILPNGLTVLGSLPAREVSEIDSAREFINEIVRYKDAFARFKERNPDLSIGSKKRTYGTIGDVFHSVANARKFIEIPIAKHKGDQHFEIDLEKGCFTLFRIDNQEERGTMSFDLIYSNWLELFYSDLVDGIIKEALDAVTVEVPITPPKPAYHNPYTEKMSGKLDEEAFNLWKHFFEESHYAEEITSVIKSVAISYSGSGDSGGTDDVCVKTESGDRHSIRISGELDSIIWRLIDSRESGFYNNEGGRGDITFTTNSFSWDHYNYITHEDHSVSMAANVDEIPDDDEFFDEITEDDYENEEEEEVVVEEEETEDEDEEDFDEMKADDLRHFLED